MCSEIGVSGESGGRASGTLTWSASEKVNMTDAVRFEEFERCALQMREAETERAAARQFAADVQAAAERARGRAEEERKRLIAELDSERRAIAEVMSLRPATIKALPSS